MSHKIRDISEKLTIFEIKLHDQIATRKSLVGFSYQVKLSSQITIRKSSGNFYDFKPILYLPVLLFDVIWSWYHSKLFHQPAFELKTLKSNKLELRRAKEGMNIIS